MDASDGEELYLSRLTTTEMLERAKVLAERQWALDLLRERHRLSLFDLQGVPVEEVKRRSAAYRADVDRLQDIWNEEDDAWKLGIKRRGC